MFSLIMLCSHFAVELRLFLDFIELFSSSGRERVRPFHGDPLDVEPIAPSYSFGRVGAGGVHVAGTTGGFAFWGVS
jgi:hypothetical protein